ncbi:MAG: creatininase family protein [Gemmatimonadota bacterium]|jgi:creatinine amidohydrolase
MGSKDNGSLSLHDLCWVDVAAHLARDSRLIVPVGSLEQHGPHLPLGTNTLIATRIAADLSSRLGVLRAPAVGYGVNYYGAPAAAGKGYAGTTSLRQKTLHRTLNEMLSAWERGGLTEFVLVTAHRHEPHLDALATLVTRTARVRVVSIWDVDVSDLLEAQPGPLHGGEAETSLMLHLYPELVRMDRARDVPPDSGDRGAFQRGRLPGLQPGSAGIIGAPTAATAEKGRRIHDRVLETISRAVFRPAEDAESDTL